MDLASVVAALASVGVRVSGSTPNSSVQVDSSRACPTGLAGPEPPGTINDPGQHFHGSRGYLNVVPLVSQPQLAPQYGPVDPATPPPRAALSLVEFVIVVQMGRFAQDTRACSCIHTRIKG